MATLSVRRRPRRRRLSDFARGPCISPDARPFCYSVSDKLVVYLSLLGAETGSWREVSVMMTAMVAVAVAVFTVWLACGRPVGVGGAF